ncbi:flagellar hook-basal body complex protein|uniref:Flagellar hook protein FlgE n=1 Tax=Dendrosporobacter quercicolus TaxID=146817 RepID=A0A1G9MJA4_9FIRM|nr:flagellar hook protein FlgE [Dendrosporobacter quercicolus]NSL47055.1 flagellar hook-basal body complex protein [Dendrosporobacter quercicolus DSM 1736]SDL74289.1 flagellar hook protein FlgE [Dendrosporobacter quercicolus]
MMRSLFAGISGLRNHQTKMDVIGNNIANVNTVGFKASTVNFQDMLSQTLQGASSPQGNLGGTNPMQIGLGMQLSSIQTLFTDGSPQTTGQPTDMAISGSGFFVLSDGLNKLYTRAGNFDFDTEGNFVSLSGGYKVMGYMADASGNIDTNQDPTAITIPKGITTPAKATSVIEFAKNLSADAEVGTSIPVTIPVFDSLGNAHNVKQVFYKTGTNTWLTGTSLVDGSAVPTNNLKEIAFTTAGEIDTIRDVTLDTASVFDISVTGLGLADAGGNFSTTVTDRGLVSHDLVFEFTGTGDPVGSPWNLTVKENGNTLHTESNFTGGDVTFSLNGTDFTFDIAAITTPAATPTVTVPSILTGATYGTASSPLSFTPVGADTVNFTLDFDGLKQYGGETTAKYQSQDGYAAGVLESVYADASGTISGKFSNGVIKSLAQVSMAAFNNPAGLTKAGNSMYTESNNSGVAQIGAANSGGRGKLTPGALEMSNVDLAQEFSNMIITQRGFQANSKIITTTDEMLQDLANLKR